MDSTVSFRGTEVRTRPRKALTDCEEEFRVLGSGIDDYALSMLHASGNVPAWNVGAEHILRYSGGEIVGRRAAVFYAEEDRALGVPAQELAKARDLYARRKDGSEFPVEIGLNPIETEVRDDAVGTPEGLEVTESTNLGPKRVAILAEQLGGELEVQRPRPTEFALRFPIIG